MGKGANKMLLDNAGYGSGTSKGLRSRADALEGFLTPQLEQEATNPEGYTPQQLAYMNTASQQSLGGGVAATTGEANLEAARTRNAGGFQGSVGTADRAAQRQLSQNALGVQERQANLQQAQRQQALSALQSLYGVDNNTALGYLTGSTQALKAESDAGNPFFKDFLQGTQGIKNLADAAASGAAAAGGG